MTRVLLVIACCLSTGVSALGQIVNADPSVRPTDRTQNCTTSGCHASQINYKLLHGPVAVKACDACHQYTDPAKHTFELKRPGRDLCEFCHIDKTGREGPVVHKPVETGDCAGCHNPHGGTTRTLLRANNTPELCASCHKEVMNGSHKHGPAAADCAICHKAHTSTHAKLLSMEKKDLCMSCHEDVSKMAIGAKHPHPPAKDDCLKCHSPHATDNPRVLLQPVRALCATCHQKTVESADHAKHIHGALTDENACLNCHVAHGSEFDKQLAQDPIASCLQCHNQPIKVDETRTVAGVPEIGLPGMHKHGAIENGDCSGCHTVHGGERDRLLVANYNNTFYQTYNENAYELCFKCHSRELIMGNTDDPQTRFRDGGRNLHAMHVNSGRQGRNCRSCHSIHASKHSQLINENVPFGAWKLPINFAPSENGGSCSPGCHEPQTYDRTKPKMAPGESASPRLLQSSVPPAPTPGSSAASGPADASPK